MNKSIRQRLFAALAGFALLICVCYTGLALVIAYVTEDMLVERLLEREAAAIGAHFRSHGEVPPASSDLVGVIDGYALLPAVVRRQAGPGDARAEVFTSTGQHYHLRALDLPSRGAVRRLYLLADVAPLLVVSKLIQEVGGVLIFVALGLIGLALLLAWRLSRRLVEPLRLLAHEVRELAPGEPPRFSARRRPDEIGYLAERLGSSIAALQAALRREHAFTRDVSHELRTPLTVMHNTLGLAHARPLDARDVAELQASLDEIRGVVDVLFALARAGHIDTELLDLRACIEQGLLRLAEEGWDSAGLQLDLPERLMAGGNRQLAGLLINNCLANALFHGGPATRLSIVFADGTLSIANSIDGGRPRRVQGFRHGQDLLLRIAQAMCWELRFESDAATYRVAIVPQALAPGAR